jgi:glycosyltransferase involved in cell wall biosynthesis
MKISVCIPAYNRPEVLRPLLDSIMQQQCRDFEVLICEDNSPARSEIAAIARQYGDRHPGFLRYVENETNLGYDGNLRRLIELARGDYCFFMGNDDVMAPDALSTVHNALARHPDVGVVLRSYAMFQGRPENVIQIFRYFDRELFFPAGAPTIITFFRRSVVISGLVLHRRQAERYATPRYDGTLLYQLHLVGNILSSMNGLALPEILAFYRAGGTPDFGNSEAERERFVPKRQTPESSLAFVRGMLDIASGLETSSGLQVLRGIFRDLGNYSYPILAIQARQPLSIFLRYAGSLASMGFWKSGMFYVYVLALLVLGVEGCGRLIGFVKQKLGRTPVLGHVYRGKSG